MAQRKRNRRRSSGQRRHGRSQGTLPRENGIIELRQLGTALGELPFVRPYADAAANRLSKVAEYVERTDYSEMLKDVSFLARRNPAATLTLGIAAGLLTAQLARGQPKGKTAQNRKGGRRSQKQSG